ncbi:MAG: hypothetical protein QHH15_02705 [Candidatus Thermoplasmatota archaeon]|jgi:LEA14-like dessication related protein|nr:hypothetical protein [Candidatus Thermoplasmatota archaeon]
MKKKIAIGLIIIAIFYIAVGALLLINIQLIEPPDVLVEIELKEINSEKAVLHAIINIENPNSFDIIARNIKMVITTPDEHEVANVSIEGGRIPSNKNTTFVENISIAFNGHSPERLISKITGEVGASILFIEKTIPLKIGVITSIEKMLNELAAPSINVAINIDDITTDNINISAEINAYNPNSFDINLNDILTEIETDTGEKVGQLDVSDTLLKGKQDTKINANGWLLLKALNAKKLIISMSGIAGVNVSGYNKNLPVNINATVNIPDLKEVLLPKDNPTILSIKVDGKITLKGFLNNITLLINNTLKVDLALRNTSIKLLTEKEGKRQILGETNIEEEIIIEAEKLKTVNRETIIPLPKFLSGVLSADWLLVAVSADLTIRGINPSVLLEIEGYQDIHLFK